MDICSDCFAKMEVMIQNPEMFKLKWNEKWKEKDYEDTL